MLFHNKTRCWDLTSQLSIFFWRLNRPDRCVGLFRNSLYSQNLIKRCRVRCDSAEVIFFKQRNFRKAIAIVSEIELKQITSKIENVLVQNMRLKCLWGINWCIHVLTNTQSSWELIWIHGTENVKWYIYSCKFWIFLPDRVNFCWSSNKIFTVK